MEDRSYLFNNAGVRMMGEGNFVVALDFFRGALESKLAYERTNGPFGNVNAAQPLLLLNQRCVTPSSDEGDSPEMESDPQPPPEPEPNIDSEGEPRISPAPDTSNNDDMSTPVPAESRGYQPFLFRHPFELPDGLTSTERTSATIVFNLGLVHHLQSRTSERAAAFYEISAALLATEPDSPASTLIKIALLNNFGIWCYENGDGESLRTCMEHLSAVVERISFPLSPDVARGVHANVQWLLTPPNGGSPAA